MSSDASEIVELREKLEALTLAQYEREEQFEQAITVRDAEIARLTAALSHQQAEPSEIPALQSALETLRVESTIAIDTWRTRLLEAQTLVSRRDVTISELTELLATAQRTVDADLRSISDYSVECPKCRSDLRSPVNSFDPTLADDLAAAKYALNASEAATSEARAFAESLAAEIGIIRQELVDTHAEAAAAASRANSAEAKAREADAARAAAEAHAAGARAEAAARSAVTMTVPVAAPHVVTDEDGDVAAANARRVAEALASYCNLLTGKLRNFRKPVKRGSPTLAPPAPAPGPRSPAGTAGAPSFPTVPSVSLGSRGSVSPAASGAASSGRRSPAKAKVQSPKPGGWELDDGWGVAATSPKKEEEDLFSMLN